MATVDITNWEYKKPLDGDSAATSPGSEKTRTIILDPNNSESNSGNVAVGYDTSRIDTSTLSSKKQSLVVTDSDESTTLNYEIENPEDLGSANEVAIHIYKSSWPQDGSTDIVLGIGGGDGTDYSQGGTGGNAWNNTGQNYDRVYHLAETSGSTIDSTPNNNDSTSTTGTTYDIDGEFNGGREGDGSDDKVDVPGLGSNLSSFMIVAWCKMDTFSSIDNAFAFRTNNVIELRTVSGENIEYSVFDGSSGISAQASFSTSSWQQFVGHWDGSTLTMYKNGSQVDTASLSNSNNNNDASSLFARDDGIRHWAGQLDEIKIQSTDSGISNPDDWAQADWEESRKSGFLAFDVQAGTTTAITDTASITTASANLLTSTESSSSTDSSSRTSASANLLTATEITSSTDSASRVTASANPLATTETLDKLDSAVITTASANSLNAVELVTIVDSVSTTTVSANPLTSSETRDLIESASITTASANILTSSSSSESIDSSSITSAQANPLTGTALITKIDSASITQASANILTSEEGLLIIDDAEITSASTNILGSSETLDYTALALTIDTSVEQILSIDTSIEGQNQ